jgi:hypothetical protein
MEIVMHQGKHNSRRPTHPPERKPAALAALATAEPKPLTVDEINDVIEAAAAVSEGRGNGTIRGVVDKAVKAILIGYGTQMPGSRTMVKSWEDIKARLNATNLEFQIGLENASVTGPSKASDDTIERYAALVSAAVKELAENRIQRQTANVGGSRSA